LSLDVLAIIDVTQ